MFSKAKESILIIERMFELCENPYISLSFGKDSLVMLDLIYKVKKIPCYFLKSEESYLMYNFEEIINSYKQSHDIDLTIIETNRLTDANFDWELARKIGHKDIMMLNKIGTHDGNFMGLRIEESKARRLTLIKKENNVEGKFIMKYKTGERAGKYRCCPIAKWSKEEIMVYLNMNNLPTLDIYRLGSHIRTTARLTGLSVFNSTLQWIRINKPENYRKILQLIPDLRSWT